MVSFIAVSCKPLFLRRVRAFDSFSRSRSRPMKEAVLPRYALTLWKPNHHDLDWLREGLADMLITGLSRSENLTVLSRRQLHMLLERLEHKPGDQISLDAALRVGQKSHAEVIVLGSFARLGGNIRIDVQLHDANTGQPVATERLVVDKPGDLLTQVDLLSLKLASRLGAARLESRFV
jgi:TolB-like protein